MRLNQRRIQRLKNASLRKPYIFSFIIIFLIYIGINLWINQTYTSLGVLTSYATWFWIPTILFTFLLIPFLVALTINLTIIKFKEMKTVKGSGFTVTGMFGGILSGACPGCFVGLFPAFLGLFGITASLSILPLYGLEIQMVSVVLLILAIILLTKDVICEVPIKKNGKRN